MGRACSTYGEEEKCMQGLIGKPKGRRPLERTKRRREDNIKIYIREVGCGGKDWINLAQNRDRRRAVMNAAMNIRVP
jgi:hypothetical protein